MDVLLFINLIMDIVIFWIVSMLFNVTLKKCKLIVGSLMAALLYCMLIIVPLLQYVPQSICAIFIPIIPILYMFKPQTLKGFFKYEIVSMGVSALLGGMTFTIWYNLGGTQANFSTLRIWQLITIALSIGGCIYMGFYSIRKRLVLPAFEYTITMIQEGRQVEIKALLDTGNCLYTPLSHKAVVVVEYEAIKLLLSEDEKACLECFNESINQWIEEERHLPQLLIPFNSTEIGRASCRERVYVLV